MERTMQKFYVISRSDYLGTTSDTDECLTKLESVGSPVNYCLSFNIFEIMGYLTEMNWRGVDAELHINYYFYVNSKLIV